MAIGTPTGIGSDTNLTAGPHDLTTSGSAPSSSLVILCVGWGASSARTLNSVSGGGLTWAIDHAQAFSGAAQWGYAVVSAQAPAGLASSTVITATFSGVVFGSLLAATYCTGLDATSPGVKDVSDGNGATGSTSWDTTATSTTVADTLVIGGSVHDGLATNTPSGGAAELHDFQYAFESWSACVEYQILSSASSASLTGTWSSGANNITSAFAAYKAAAGAAAAPVLPPTFVAIPLMR